MDLALEVKTGKGRVRGKNSHPTFLDWKLDGVGKIFGGRRGREGTIQKKWRGPKSGQPITYANPRMQTKSAVQILAIMHMYVYAYVCTDCTRYIFVVLGTAAMTKYAI